jgi:alginate O-acetyltransferase complex protein AlgI
MVFSSLVFLFVFLPLTLLLYHASPRPVRNSLLLVASLLFYTWGESLFVLLVLLSIALNFSAGLLIDRNHGSPRARTTLLLAVVVNLGLLGVFKYANFFADNLDVLLAQVGIGGLELDPIHLPIGISFFTFQALSYVIDVYRREAPVERNPLNVALYVSMFPQLIAGPIVRYHDVAAQIRERVVGSKRFASGIRRFILGLGKKVLIANVLGHTADRIFDLELSLVSAPIAWLGVICYAFQIYFDFSGYSDMAIGLGRMFGFEFLENFRHPYVATSVKDFWRRWHISLSTWFRDYVYIPLGGSRLGSVRTTMNLLTVFLLCGLWHGASWSFVVWGLVHGLFLVLERGRLGAVLVRLWRPLRHAYVLLVVLVGWVFFRVETLPEALGWLSAMLGGAPASRLPVGTLLDVEVVATLLVAATASLPLAGLLERWRRSEPDNSAETGSPTPAPGLALLRLVSITAIFSLSVVYLTADTYKPFIYFRF